MFEILQELPKYDIDPRSKQIQLEKWCPYCLMMQVATSFQFVKSTMLQNTAVK